MSAIGDRRAGATLIEAMVVIAILAMIGSIGFPELRSSLRRAIFHQAAAGLRADMRMARAQALSSGSRVDLTVTEDGMGYGWTPGPRRALVGGVQLRPTGPAASFFPDGSSTGGRLALSADGRRFEVGIDPVTGLPEPLR